MATLVRHVMTEGPKTLGTSMSAADAAGIMANFDVGAVPVTNDDGSLAGIVTDRDIVIRAVAEGLNPESAPVASVCSKDLTTVSPEDDIESAMALMRDKALRRVLVVDWENAPLGIVSLGDLAIARDARSVLGQISAAPPNR